MHVVEQVEGAAQDSTAMILGLLESEMIDTDQARRLLTAIGVEPKKVSPESPPTTAGDHWSPSRHD
jgi:hypothetical protein